jgi:hypothetical protein
MVMVDNVDFLNLWRLDRGCLKIAHLAALEGRLALERAKLACTRAGQWTSFDSTHVPG